MTIIIDDISAPGAWARHLRDTQCMRHCSPCGVSAWHPEVASCAFVNCPIRARSASDAGAGLSSLGPAPAVRPMVQTSSHASQVAR